MGNLIVPPLTKADLLSKIKIEDHFVERKSFGDSKDWLKTVVAFANSTPVGYPAFLFIGVKDDGTPETGVNIDTVQKTFADKMKAAYPPIYYFTEMLEQNGAQFLVVTVPGSADRPHFAGPSYIRKGSKTEAASEQQFDELLATRLSKSREILRWKNKAITIDFMNVEHIHTIGAIAGSTEQVVIDCNSFYVTLANQLGHPGQSIPLRRVEVSFDGPKGRLKLEIYPI